MCIICTHNVFNLFITHMDTRVARAELQAPPKVKLSILALEIIIFLAVSILIAALLK